MSEQKSLRGSKASPSRPVGGSPGFTLLELIIAIALSAVIAVIMSQALSLSIRAREVGERRAEADQRARIILNKISGEIASVYFYRYKSRPGQQGGGGLSNSTKREILAFKGSNETLSFVSSGKLAGEEAGGGLKEVSIYTLSSEREGEDNLYILERRLAPLTPLDIPKKSDKEFIYSDLISSLLFRYLLVDKKKSPAGNTFFTPEYWEESYNLNPPTSKTSKPVLIGVEVSLSLLEGVKEGVSGGELVGYPPLFIRVHANQEIIGEGGGI